MANIIIVHLWVLCNKKRIKSMISYEPLWNTLKLKGISQYQLINKYHVSAGQLSRLRINSYVSTHTLDRLCEILDCKLEDIAVYKKEETDI